MRLHSAVVARIGSCRTDLCRGCAARGKNRGFLIHIFERVCRENGIEHRLTKPSHPWTNGQAERMVRTIKEATVKSFHYTSIIELRRHVGDWLIACNFAKQLKAQNPLRGGRGTLEIKACRLYRQTHDGTKYLGAGIFSAADILVFAASSAAPGA